MPSEGPEWRVPVEPAVNVGAAVATTGADVPNGSIAAAPFWGNGKHDVK